MDVRDGFIGAIGETTLIRLKAASEATGCEILGKAEFLNPGGSVKDRAALYIVRDAEERGLLRPGGEIVPLAARECDALGAVGHGGTFQVDDDRVSMLA